MRPLAWFKAALFVLQAANAVVFVRQGTASEALDSLAWFVLLVLFAAETGTGRVRHRFAAALIRGIRAAAAAAVGVAAVGYLGERAWVDAINAWLWLAVVGLLELEVRRPDIVALHRAVFGAAAAVLYGGLAAIVLVWAWAGDWFDAYDALLWLTAFATIEVDVLGTALAGDSVGTADAGSAEGAAKLGDKA